MSADILLIEDEPDLRAEMMEYLVRRGHLVTGCASIEQGYEALADAVELRRPPHVVIADIRLPDGDGVSFYVANARRFPGTRWVLVSGNHDLVRLAERIQHLSDLPRCVILDKPVCLRLLNRFINSVRAPAATIPSWRTAAEFARSRG